MKITRERIKEIIREEITNLNNEALKYREESPFSYEPIEGMDIDRAQALTGNYNVKFLGVRDTGAGETEYLVQLPDGSKDVINVQVSGMAPRDDDEPQRREPGERGRMYRGAAPAGEVLPNVPKGPFQMKLSDLKQLIREELEAFQAIGDVEAAQDLTAAQAKDAKLDVLVNKIADIMGVQADLDMEDKEGIASVIDDRS